MLTTGILPSYTHWFRHGEERHFQTYDSLDSDDESDGDGLSEMVQDYCAAFNTASCVARDSSGDDKNSNKSECQVCGLSRWKSSEGRVRCKNAFMVPKLSQSLFSFSFLSRL